MLNNNFNSYATACVLSDKISRHNPSIGYVFTFFCHDDTLLSPLGLAHLPPS